MKTRLIAVLMIVLMVLTVFSTVVVAAFSATGVVSAATCAATTTTCATTTSAQCTSCTTAVCCCCPCPVTCCCPVVACCVVTKCCEVKVVKAAPKAAAAAVAGSGQASANAAVQTSSIMQIQSTGAVSGSNVTITFATQTANPTQGNTINVVDPYRVPLGQNRVWNEKLFNVHDTTVANKLNLADITCSSLKSTLATDVNIKGSPMMVSEGNCFSWLGVKFQIADITTQPSWNFVKNKQVRISTTVDYAFDGITKIPDNSKLANAAVSNSLNLTGGANPTLPNVVQNIGSMNEPGTISKTHVTTSVTTTLDKLSTGIPGQCQITVPLATGAYGLEGGTAHASGKVVVTNIQLEWV